MTRRGNHELTFSLSKQMICRNDEPAVWIYLFVCTILKVSGLYSWPPSGNYVRSVNEDNHFRTLVPYPHLESRSALGHPRTIDDFPS